MSQTLHFPNSRVAIRPLQLEDGPALTALAVESREVHHPWIHPPRNADEFAELVERMRQPASRGWTVVDLSSGAPIGFIGLSQIFMGAFGSAYSSYWIGKGHEGQGKMTEAMRLMLHVAFREIGLHRIEANVQPGNLASIALVRGLGFVKEGYSENYLKILGEWKDHERWAIRGEIWPDATLPKEAQPFES